MKSGRRPKYRLFVAIAALAALSLDGLTAVDYARLQQLAAQRYGAQGTEQVRAWRTLVSNGRSKPDAEKIRLANLFFNFRIGFSDDVKIWGENDFWATPLQTMGRGLGDCEDFSIAKYATLLEMGMRRDKLRLIYVKAQYQGRTQAHMVLGYFPTPDAEPLILDNINGEILPASSRSDLFPVFSFNSEGLWAGGKTVSDPSSRLSRWRSVLDRMAADGFTGFARTAR